MSHTVQDREHVLHVLASCHPKQRKAILQTADDKLVKAVCECSLNLVKGNIPLTQEQKRKFHRHRYTLRRLGKKTTPLPRKKKILAQQGGFVGLLLKTILPTLASLLFKR